MPRLWACLVREYRLQQRNGLYAATLLLLLFWIVLLNQLHGDLNQMLPSFAIGNLMVGVAMFAALLSHMEQAERSDLALALTPVRRWERLLARALLLSAAALAETLVILLVASQWRMPHGLIVLACLIACAIYACLGDWVGRRTPSFNAMLPQFGLLMAFLWLPLIVDLLTIVGWRSVLAVSDWWLLHPFGGVMQLAHAALRPFDLGQIVLPLCTSLLWLGCGWWFVLARAAEQERMR
ncbi:MAG: hypothetical protein Fur005_39630 [Roseiflexaceae bacterium]